MIRRMIGKQAPNFEMEAIKPKMEIEKISLDEYKQEDRWVVLFFYPMNFSPICTTEIIALTKRYEEFEKLDAQIIAISTDSIKAHEVWVHILKKELGLDKLPFPLAADTNQTVTKEYGVLVEEHGIALRGTFIVHPNGEIKYQLVIHEHIGRDIDEILRALAAIQTGEKCPANWKPGDKTF